MTKKDIAFLFDLDGVLIDSERKYTQIWNLINEKFPTGVENFSYKIKGTTLEDILAKYYPEKDIREKVEEILYLEEGKMRYEYTPGAHKLLQWLKDNEIPTALVTSSNEKKMRHLYDHIPGIADYFNVIITGDMVSNSKPNPEGYLHAASKLGIDIRRCVVFEDSLQGVKAGKNAGALVVGVVGTLHREDIEPFSDILTNGLENLNPSDIVEILEKR